MHGRSRRTRAWQGHARARGHTTRMRVATNRAGILLAIMRPGQLKTHNSRRLMLTFSLGVIGTTLWKLGGHFVTTLQTDSSGIFVD